MLPGLVLNVPAIALKSPVKVAAILGPPEHSGGVQPGADARHRYKGGSVEVIFVGGRACWIKLYNPRNLPFSKDSLTSFFFHFFAFALFFSSCHTQSLKGGVEPRGCT